MREVGGLKVIVCAAFLTATEELAVNPPSAVRAVMVADPSATAVTIPDVLTVAT